MAIPTIKNTPKSGIVYVQPGPVIRTGGAPKNRTYRIVETEALTTLTTKAAVTVNTNHLIPLSFTGFLAGIASNFSKWRWIKLRLIYIPECTDETPGTINFGLLFDAADLAPTTGNQMSMMSGFTTTRMSNGFAGASALDHPNMVISKEAIYVDVDCTKFAQRWYPFINTAGLASLTVASDINMYSPARLVYLRQNGPATDVAGGTIYAQYDIELASPVPTALNF